MQITEIKKGDYLVNVDQRGASYYQVLKVNRVTIEVLNERGGRVKAYPHIFDRKVLYTPEAFK